MYLRTLGIHSTRCKIAHYNQSCGWLVRIANVMDPSRIRRSRGYRWRWMKIPLTSRCCVTIAPRGRLPLPISSLLSLVSSIWFRARSRVSTNPSSLILRPVEYRLNLFSSVSETNDVYDVYSTLKLRCIEHAGGSRIEFEVSSPAFEFHAIRERDFLTISACLLAISAAWSLQQATRTARGESCLSLRYNMRLWLFRVCGCKKRFFKRWFDVRC